MSTTVSWEDAKAEQAAEDAAQGLTPPQGQPTPRPRPQEAAQPAPQVSAAPQPPSPAPAPEPVPDPAAQAAAAQADEERQILVPDAKPKVWNFGRAPDGKPIRSYTQYGLSVIAKTQWFSLVGEFLDHAMSGDSALSLAGILSPPEPQPGASIGDLRLQDFKEADTFVHAVGKLLIDAPDFTMKSICIWLSVPDYEWELVMELMKQPPDLGGLSDDTFEQIFNLFVDQNYPTIISFFRERLARMRDRLQDHAKLLGQSRSPRR